MMDFLSFVPWDDHNAEVWSPRLASLLINIGSSIDSTFKTFRNSRQLADGDMAKELREKSEPNIGDYAATYGSVFPFASKVVYLLADHSALTPWKDWASLKPGEKVSPSWWTAYNQVKHDRFANSQLATLRTGLIALAGFFAVCVLVPEIREHLYCLGVIHHVGSETRGGIHRMQVLMPQSWLEVARLKDPSERFYLPVYVDTSLFALFLSSDKNVAGQRELLDSIAPR